MNYRVFVKRQFMRGKLKKVRDFGISSGSLPQMQLNHYSGGTISHRAVVGPLIPDIGGLRVNPSKKGGRIRKIYDVEKTGKGKNLIL